MPKKFLTLVLLSAGMIAAGCSSVNKKYYVEVKERVDQDQYGNAGYLTGTAPAGYQTGFKKTRKVYVMEVTKKPDEETNKETPQDKTSEEKTESSAASTTQTESSKGPSLADKISEQLKSAEETSAPPPPTISLTEEERREILRTEPPQESAAPAPPAEVEPVPSESAQVWLPTEYTVQANDTLQTISKKFYDTYKKWPEIYKANKEKIPDPNKIKKGMVLTIPAI